MRPEPSRRFPVPGLWGYVDRLAVSAGDLVQVHVSSEATFGLDVVRLGERAILDPGATIADDRGDVRVVAAAGMLPPAPGSTMPGSYIWVGGPPIESHALTMGLWLRPWRLPYRETGQWSAAGIMTDLDYPDHCGVALLLGQDGNICAYVGDGGPFRHDRLIRSAVAFGDRMGIWTHVALGIDDGGTTLWIDGNAVSRERTIDRVPTMARLRIGAAAEGGVADWHMDADLSQPFVVTGKLHDDDIGRVVGARGLGSVARIVGRPAFAEWSLAEECGARVADESGNARHGTIVNGGAWQIGGPSFDAAISWPGYDPSRDTRRGHGLRLSSDDLRDAEWPVAYEYRVPDDPDPGFYAARIRMHGQREESWTTVPFIVRSPAPAARVVALVVPTNTWHAYGRQFDGTTPPRGLHSSFYTVHESGLPFFWLGTSLPIPRADPFGFNSTRAERQGHSQLVRPERIAAAWLRHHGYPVDLYVDQDLHEGTIPLASYASLLLAGHSEYWSHEMRTRVEAYLAGGGNVLSLSGDTASQRVSMSNDDGLIEARKAHDTDRTWLTPERWGERWHSCDAGPGGTFRSLGRHAWTMLGVSTQGMIDDGTPTSYAPLTVLEPDHPLFHDPEVVPMVDGMIGNHSLNGVAVSGYEFDSVPTTTGFRDEPLPGLTVLASALGQPNLGWIGRSPDHGADSIHWVRPAGGEVFTISSIGASGSLPIDPGVGALVRNVLARFGVAQERP